MFGARIMRMLRAFKTVIVVDAAELEPMDLPQSARGGLLVISQSGETKDVMRALNLGLERDIPCMSVVNAVGSTVARSSRCGVYLNAGREVAVASTKAFTCQATVLTEIAVWFAQNRGEHGVEQYAREACVTSLQQLSLQMQAAITRCHAQCRSVAQMLHDKRHNKVFVLGKGAAHPIALEGALKIKEIGYIQAEGYAGGALKHGPFALIEKGTPIFLIILEDADKRRMQTAAAEVHARGAFVVAVTDSEEVAKDRHVDLAIRVPSCGLLTAVLATIPFQLIAYELAVANGNDPDKPRNLAKSGKPNLVLFLLLLANLFCFCSDHRLTRVHLNKPPEVVSWQRVGAGRLRWGGRMTARAALLLVLTVVVGSARGSLVYTPEMYNSDAEAESDRLKAQVDMSFAKEFEMFRGRLALSRRLLEVACGPGHYSERLLVAMPRLSIVCVEIEPRFIAQSTARLRRFGRRFRAVRGDVTRLSEVLERAGEKGPFDACVMRLILQHLPGQHAEVVGQARSLLRAERGVLVLLDVDEAFPDLLTSALPVGDALMARMAAHRSSKGAVPDGTAGRRLRGLLEGGGLRGAECGAALSSSDDFGMAVLRRVMRETAYGAVATAEESKRAAREVRDTFRDEWDTRRTGEGRPLLLSLMFVCTALAPPRPQQDALRELQ